MISIRARIVRWFIRQLFRTLDGDTDVAEARQNWERFAGKLKPVPGTTIERSTVAGVDCEWIIPPNRGRETPVVLYLHGGAYIAGSSATHRAMVSHLAALSGMRILLPNYRLAPEHPFPAGLDDSIAVCRSLLETSGGERQVGIAGDSAGGGMTLAVLMALRTLQEPLPAAAYLISPWLDLTGSGPSMESRAAVDPMFRPADMAKVAAQYAPSDRLRDPRVSPVFGEFHGLPPLLVQVGDQEILLSDSIRLADGVSAAGGRVTLQVWPELWHVFQYSVGRMPESKRALTDAATFLQKELAP